MLPKSTPRYRDLPRAGDQLYPNAWGVFGFDDQLGTLNHLTPQAVLRGVQSVVKGDVFSLNLSLTAFDPPLIAHRGIPRHEVFGLNEFHRDDRIDNLFMQASTQIDGLRHFAHPDAGFYNGVDGQDLAEGTTALGIQHVAERGVAGRGLLLDVERYRAAIGRPLDHNSNDTISVADLEGTIDRQSSPVRSGDILMVQTGWLRELLAGRVSRERGLRSPGLEASEEVAEWLWDHDIALAASDNLALESWPAREERLPTQAEQASQLPRSSHTGMLHRLLIPLLGLTIGELWHLDRLATACREDGRYDCLVTVAPLNMPGAVGSPANATAIR